MPTRSRKAGRVLPDVLAEGLEVVFCGTAAGKRSAEVGAYYAGKGNKFWPILHSVGLTPHLLEPHQFRDVLLYGIGFTDLAKFASGADAGLSKTDFCASSLRQVLLRYHPRILAFTSKRAAKEFYGHSVNLGLQSEMVEGAQIFVLTSPSGLASGYWQNGRHWHDLAALVQQ